MSECSCAEMGEALKRQEQRIAELEAENAALRADARLGALVRRLPELGSVPGSYERVGLCCEGQWSWKTERSNILSTAFSPSHETPDEALAAALGEETS